MTSRAMLRIYGIELNLVANDDEARKVLAWLTEDFVAFEKIERPSTGMKAGMKLVFDLHSTPLVPADLARAKRELTIRFKLFRTKMCSVYGLGSFRICDYGNGAAVIARNEKNLRSFAVHGTTIDELYELAYTAVLSAVGESLDLQGFHRVHGLGVGVGTAGSLVCFAPQGAGKSALASCLMRDRGARILSDESPLVHRGQLWPFPLRVALRPDVVRALELYPEVDDARSFQRRLFPEKLLFSIPDRNRMNSGSLIKLILLMGPRCGNQSSKPLHPAGLSAKVRALFLYLFLGWGLMQMAEHMLRIDREFSLLRIAFSRFRESLVLLTRTGFYHFETVADARINAKEFQRIFDEAAEISDATH